MSAVIDLDLPGDAILRRLIYPIQFEADPLNGVDRVVDQVVFAEHSRLPVRDVIAAIDAGLAGYGKLSELIPQPHSEVVIRGFLSALRKHLEIDPERP